VLALAGSIVLVVLAALTGDAWKIVGVAVYGAALCALYSVSTLYHALRGRAKVVFRALDHQSIYLLIAGTYTPFCLVTLRGPWGWSMFGVVWGLALAGGLQEIWLGRGARVVSVLIYLVMGWVVVLAWGPLTRALGADGVTWLVAGGLLYTVGIVFYAIDARVRHAHGVWHLFVLGGSASHYAAVLRHVL